MIDLESRELPMLSVTSVVDPLVFPSFDRLDSLPISDLRLCAWGVSFLTITRPLLASAISSGGVLHPCAHLDVRKHLKVTKKNYLADYRPDGTIVQTTEQAAEHDSTAAKFSRKMRTDNELPKPDTFTS